LVRLAEEAGPCSAEVPLVLRTVLELAMSIE